MKLERTWKKPKNQYFFAKLIPLLTRLDIPLRNCFTAPFSHFSKQNINHNNDTQPCNICMYCCWTDKLVLQACANTLCLSNRHKTHLADADRAIRMDMLHIFHEPWPVSEPRFLAIYSWQRERRGGWNSVVYFVLIYVSWRGDSDCETVWLQAECKCSAKQHLWQSRLQLRLDPLQLAGAGN